MIAKLEKSNGLERGACQQAGALADEASSIKSALSLSVSGELLRAAAVSVKTMNVDEWMK